MRRGGCRGSDMPFAARWWTYGTMLPSIGLLMRRRPRTASLDVVFANAGIDPGPGFLGSWVGAQRPRNPEGALENYTDERWNRVIDINLNGIFATLRAGARLMRPQRSGRMIVTTSVAAYQCEPAIGAAYMTAKAGAAHLMRQVALELAAYRITWSTRSRRGSSSPIAAAAMRNDRRYRMR